MANTTWNPSDKSANCTLSSGNLGAGTSTIGYARAVDRQATGKFYWEVTATTWSNGNTGHGFSAGWLGIPSGGTPVGLAVVYNAGTIWVNNVNTGMTLGARAAGNILGIATDIDAELAWFRVAPSGNWNGSGTANPVTGVGGVSISSILTYPFSTILPVFATGSNESCLANFGDSAFSGTVPSGFTAGYPAGTNPPTYIVGGGMAREALVSSVGEVNLGGIAREALVSGVGAVSVEQQYFVSVVT